MSSWFSSFEAAGELLGLRRAGNEQNDLQIALDGVVDTIRVHIFHGPMRTSTGSTSISRTHIVAYLEPRADLRMIIRTAGLDSKVSDFFGKHDINVGDARFDPAFVVRANEPERVKAFLNEEMREALLGWKERASHVAAPEGVTITDESVQISFTPFRYSSDDIVTDARALVSLARVANRALCDVPSSTLLAPHIEAWRAFAEHHRLTFSASPLYVSGELEGTRFTASAVPADDGAYGVDIGLRFEQRLPWFLRIRPSRFLDVFERTGDASHLGTNDALFDQHLRVTTTDAEKTSAFLDVEVRKALLGLHAAEGQLLLDSEGMSVRTQGIGDASTFTGVVERIALVAKKLHARAFPDVSASSEYR